MFGAAGGAGGTGFAGPESAQIVNPIQSGQLAASATGNQQALAQQQALVQALQAQNGIGNQSNIYNQLQGVVSGTGPNPAQAQLAQATGANTANQAALMAGQRGAGSNVGLMARQAAQQGAANQQSAAGQAATLQANQSLNALQSAGNIANTQVANQMGAVNSNTGAQQAQQAALFGAQQGVNNAHVGMQSNINNVNGQLANTQLQGQQATTGGLMNASALTNALARGGKVKRYDDGGAVPDTSTPSFGSDSGAQALSGQKSGGGGGLLALLADGGSVGVGSSLATQPSPMGPQSFIGRYMNSSSSEGP